MINPSLFFRFFNRKYLFCSLPSDTKNLYLTFDDGPVPEVTEEVLRILRNYNAHATFFCLGDNVRKNPTLLQTIVTDGHTVGNHTFSHLDGWRTPPGEYAENVTRCEQYYTTNLFRPPFGRFNLSQYYLLRKKYTFVLWSVMSFDFRPQTTPAECLSNIIDNSVPGSVIVFHDTLKAREKMLYALPHVLEHFQKNGFRFEKISL